MSTIATSRGGGGGGGNGKSVSIDELLSDKWCVAVEGGLKCYGPGLRLNIGEGPGKGFAPEHRLRRLTTTALLHMAIQDHEHQRAVMAAVRGWLASVDAKRAKEEEEKAAAAARKEAKAAARAQAAALEPAGGVTLPPIHGGGGGGGGGGVGVAQAVATPQVDEDAAAARRGGGKFGLQTTKKPPPPSADFTAKALASVMKKRQVHERRGDLVQGLRSRKGSERQGVCAAQGGDRLNRRAGALDNTRAAVALPRYQAQVAQLRAFIRGQVAALKELTQCAHAYVVCCDPKHGRLFHFLEPPPAAAATTGSNGNGKRQQAAIQNGPANAYVWSSHGDGGSSGVVPSVLRACSPMLLEDAAGDDRWDPVNEPYLGKGFTSGNVAARSVLAVPVLPVHPPGTQVLTGGQSRAVGGTSEGFGPHDTVAVLVLLNKVAGPRCFSAKDALAVKEAAAALSAPLEDHFFAALEHPLMQDYLEARKL